MNNHSIIYPIDREYLPDWGWQEILREIYQNFTDFGDFKEEVKSGINNETRIISLLNYYKPNSLHFLKIGNTDKRNDKTKIGQHGEGLKVAFFVLTREQEKSKLFFSTLSYANISFNEKAYSPRFSNNNELGEVFELCQRTDFQPIPDDYSFMIQIEVPTEEFNKFKSKRIEKSDIIHESPFYGRLINKNAGDIYVGGTYVCNIPTLKYAYDFNTDRVALDRDRKVPSSFDVEYNASHILSTYENLSKDDLFERDCSYVTNIPDEICEEFEPVLRSGKIFLESEGQALSGSIKDTMMKNPKILNEVINLKYKMNRKRKPENLLKEWLNKHKHILHPEEKSDFEVILRKSKNWDY